MVRDDLLKELKYLGEMASKLYLRTPEHLTEARLVNMRLIDKTAICYATTEQKPESYEPPYREFAAVRNATAAVLECLNAV